jgi:hypothetical protein
LRTPPTELDDGLPEKMLMTKLDDVVESLVGFFFFHALRRKAIGFMIGAFGFEKKKEKTVKVQGNVSVGGRTDQYER